MLKTKKGFLLRRLGDEFMVVAIGEASKSFNGMIRLNDTGAFYWKELEKGSSEDDLTAKTLERYEGVDQETARRDVREFLQSIEVALEHAASNDLGRTGPDRPRPVLDGGGQHGTAAPPPQEHGGDRAPARPPQAGGRGPVPERPQ